jgi:signal recognition particle subunit SRP68
VSVQKLEQTRAVLGRLVTQYRALAQLKVLTGSNKKDTATNTAGAVKPPPLIERLRRNEYVEDVDLSNLVNYPPTLRPVPVKPLFFDLAWNYIHYPSEKGAPTNDADSAGAGQTRTAGAAAVNGTSNEQQQTDKSTKRGWFGFGR